LSREGTEILDSIYQRAIDNGLITAKFEQGRIGLLFSVIAKELQIFEQFIENYIAEMNLSTAQDPQAIELLASPYHMRQPAKTSSVILRFTKDETVTTDFIIPYNTIVETSDLNPITYYTVEEKTLYKENDYVDILAFSTEAGSSTIVKPNTLIIIKENNLRGISVTNPEASYGGTNQEDLETLRRSALAFRYQLERGTYNALEEEIRDYGIELKDFNIVEGQYGWGSVSIFIDTVNKNVIREIERLCDQYKASGIYLTCEEVTPVPISFNFKIQISSRRSLYPEERNRLRDEISSIFRTLVDENGVGNSLILSQIISLIYHGLQGKWAISDIHIEVDGAPENIDEHGNIILESWEIVKVEELNIKVETG